MTRLMTTKQLIENGFIPNEKRAAMKLPFTAVSSCYPVQYAMLPPEVKVHYSTQPNPAHGYHTRVR